MPCIVVMEKTETIFLYGTGIYFALNKAILPNYKIVHYDIHMIWIQRREWQNIVTSFFELQWAALSSFLNSQGEMCSPSNPHQPQVGALHLLRGYKLFIWLNISSLFCTATLLNSCALPRIVYDSHTAYPKVSNFVQALPPSQPPKFPCT